MNVEIGAKAAQFPEKEYINGIAVAVCRYHITVFDKAKKGKHILEMICRKRVCGV
jgi:hypothetical protein